MAKPKAITSKDERSAPYKAALKKASGAPMVTELKDRRDGTFQGRCLRKHTRRQAGRVFGTHVMRANEDGTFDHVGVSLTVGGREYILTQDQRDAIQAAGEAAWDDASRAFEAATPPAEPGGYSERNAARVVAATKASNEARAQALAEVTAPEPAAEEAPEAPAAEPTVHQVATEDSRYDDAGHYESEAVVTVEGTAIGAGPGGFGVGGWTAEGKGRLVTGGPEVQGPHGFIFGLCGVIDNHGGTAAIRERKRAQGLLIEAKAGDILEMHGDRFEIKVDAHGYPRLEVVES